MNGSARRCVMFLLPVLVLGGVVCGADPCDLITTFEQGRTPTRTIHVAVDGSNTTGDGSAASPYATIGFAAARATPGTAVVIHAGTYPGGTFLTDLAGTAEAPIWIGGAPGEARPLISGGGEGLHLVRPRYVIIHDLEVAGASSNGINADDGGEYANPLAAHHVVFRNLSIHDVGGSGNQDGLKLSGLNDFWVIDCEIARCGGANAGSGIDHVGCHRGLIARCFLHDLSGNAVQCKGGSEDIEVRWCVMDEAGQRAVNIGGSTGLQFFRPPVSASEPNAEARNIRVVSNVIRGGQCAVAFVGCVGSVAANNTILTPHNWILRILQETTSGGGYTFLPCGDNRFVNNLVYFERADLSVHVNVGPNTAPGTFVFANNLWYAYDDPSASAPNLPVPESDGIVGKSPGLADPDGGDGSIGPESPAAGAGLAPAVAQADVRGTCYRDPPSIGAFELACEADCDRNGELGVGDFTCFRALYLRGDPAADCDGDGGLSVGDFGCFRQRFLAGCG